jgi:hypothetical protein
MYNLSFPRVAHLFAQVKKPHLTTDPLHANHKLRHLRKKILIALLFISSVWTLAKNSKKEAHAEAQKRRQTKRTGSRTKRKNSCLPTDLMMMMYVGLSL